MWFRKICLSANLVSENLLWKIWCRKICFGKFVVGKIPPPFPPTRPNNVLIVLINQVHIKYLRSHACNNFTHKEVMKQQTITAIAINIKDTLSSNDTRPCQCWERNILRQYGYRICVLHMCYTQRIFYLWGCKTIKTSWAPRSCQVQVWFPGTI